MINKIYIKNYRNINEIQVSPSNSINLIVHKNSAGKTNFIESIYYTIKGESFKPISDNSEVIGPEVDYAKVNLTWENSQIESVVSKLNESVTRKFFFNAKVTRLSNIYKKYFVVVFSPNSVDLVSGEPSIRRSDLDHFLSSIDAEYDLAIKKYKVILKNRNALIKRIKEGFAARSELDFWNSQITTIGTILYSKRKDFFVSIKQFIEEAARSIYSNMHDFSFNYKSFIEVKNDSYIDSFKQKLAENIDKEVIVGKTLYGPHKDDYEFIFNTKNLKYFGSRGQQRMATLIYKIAQFKYIIKNKGETPILLLDDLFSELDETHRKNISEFLLNLETQIFITSADRNEIPMELQDSGQEIKLI